jgi:phosphoribosylformylglycinamidine synthase I
MAHVRALVLRAAGTNCDLETVHAFERAGAAVERLHINRLRERPAELERFQVLAIPGGFTYGDDLGAGRVLANELRFHLAEPLARFVEGGKLVIGICNGFQVLVKAGMLPGGGPATLTNNDSGKFEARWIHVEATTERTPWLKKGDRMHIPTAHGEGKFVSGAPEVRARMAAQGQVALKYVRSDGSAPGGAYPENPSGSEDDIAGVCDATGRILGLMPHPERHIEFHHHPRWTREGLGPQHEGEGLRVFRNAVEHLSKS